MCGVESTGPQPNQITWEHGETGGVDLEWWLCRVRTLCMCPYEPDCGSAQLTKFALPVKKKNWDALFFKTHSGELLQTPSRVAELRR